MKDLFLNKEQVKVHFVGVGGISTSALAEHLFLSGYTVSGSDLTKNSQTEKLKKLGVTVFTGHSENNLNTPDLVVYSSAIKSDNPELKSGAKTISRSQLLGKIVKGYSKSVGISGSHGKTTATAMLSKILIESKKDPTVFLGGEDLDYGNYRKGESKYAVVECCEYARSFLDIKPKIVVVLNVDNDHLDTYKDMKGVISAFKQFVGENLAVINADDKYCYQLSNCTTVTFGTNNSATYSAKNLKKEKDGYSFNAYAYSRNYGKIRLNVKGKHNVYNALSAFATADLMGIPFADIKKGLESFYGVKRRNEYLGEYGDKKWYADYAHHPKEIIATLNAFREDGEEFITVFQPHTYSRTRILEKDFISALKNTGDLIIYKTYPAREKYDKKGSAKTLAEKIINAGKRNCEYAHTRKELFEKILTVKAPKVLVLGAGDIYEITKKKTFYAKVKKSKK